MDGLPETHIERMDRLAFDAAQEEKRLRIQADRDIAVARERRKEARAPYLMGAVFAVAVAGLLFSLVYAWWIIPDPPKTPEDYRSTEAGREQACIGRGGGWVPKDLLRSGNGGSDHGMCVFPGQRAN